MTTSPKTDRIFNDRRQGVSHRVVLPWGRTLAVCWLNIRHRMGRSILTFVCIAVVVAFFMSSLTYQNMVNGFKVRVELLTQPEYAAAVAQANANEAGGEKTAEVKELIHVQAVLEKAGVFTHDVEAMERERDQRLWLMLLSLFLCLVGITNTILMSVTERYREIGTLKCLGALDSFIVRLFLIESVFVGILASLAGSAVGYLLALLQVGAVFEFSLLTAGTCTAALAKGVPVAVGLGALMTTMAAVYPTYVAARMKPVDAMRTEV